MLIRPDGAAAWNEQAEINETDGSLDRATKRETGDSITQGMNKTGDLRGRKVYWRLPDSFCVHCARTDISPEEQNTGTMGVFEFHEPMPHLHMVPGDVILYRTCGKCWDHERFGNKPAVYDFGYQKKRFQETVQETKQRHVEEWIRMAILRGEKPLSPDHGNDQ